MVPIILLFVFAIGMLVLGGMFFSMIRSFSGWNRIYAKLGKRYAGKQANRGVFYGYLISNPGLSFDYGRTFCFLKNRKSSRFLEGKQTEITMTWPSKRPKLEVVTPDVRTRNWRGTSMTVLPIKDQRFHSNFTALANKGLQSGALLTSGVQWQLEQLRRHTAKHSLCMTLNRGSLSIAKPGYIKDYQQLDDFIRFSLELFDQMMLVGAEGIEFLHENEAAVVEDVKCPICSEAIMHEMVVCTRCKTPHCLDCWQYNGQCATFACSETRFVRAGGISV